LGLRRGELLALRWENVDLDNGAVYIVENAVQINSTSQRVVKPPKTESGNRRIEIPPSLIKMLRKGKVTYLESKLRLGRSFTDSGLVVCLPDGKPYLPGYFSQKVHRLLDSKGIRRIRIHDFRHTNATLMLKQGISPKVAQSRLGHSTISVTMDTYTHVLDDMEKEAANKLEECIYLDDAVSN
jgi:integrase